MSTVKPIEMGWACNNGCAHCPLLLNGVEAAPPPVTVEDFRSSLGQARAEGAVPRLTGGEPLTHPELKAILAHLLEDGGPWTLDTNGRRLSYMNLAKAAVRSGLRAARVGLVSSVSEVHDRVVDVQGAFNESIAGIENLRSLDVEVTLSVVLSEANIRQLDGLVSLADSLGVGLSLRWPERGREEASIGFAEGARSVRNAFSLAMVHHRWARDRFEVVDLPRCMAPEALLEIRGGDARPAGKPPICRDCTQSDRCPGPTQAQMDRGIWEHLRPFVSAPRGYVFEEEACKEVEIPDLKTCVLRKPEAERPGADEVLIAGDVPGVFVLHRPVESGHENTGVLKNLTGYIQDPRQKERVLYLDKNCQGCRVLTRCGAVFGAASEAGTLAIDRDAHKAPSVHRVLECDTSEELSQALLDRLHEGERRGVVRGLLPSAGGGARSGLGPNDIFRAILGQPWKVEEVRLPDARSGGVFEVHVAAVDGQGSAGLHNLAAVALLKRCNLRCIMCQIPVLYPESDVPAPDLFRTFLELRLHGFDWLTTFGGEPLLRADLEGLIEAARMLGFGVDMVTNGSYLDAERAKSLAKSGLNFCMVSVDGATADTHDFVRAKEGSFLEAIAGLKNFRANAPDARLELNSVIVEENKHQLRDLVNLAGDLEVNRANLFLCVSAPVLAPDPHWLDVPSLKKILTAELPALRAEATKKGIDLTLSPGFPEGRLDEFIQEAAVGTYNLYYESGTRCQAPDKEIFVSVKQEVYGCASPTVLESGTALGALNQQSLGSIYATAKAQHFSGSAADHDPCKMCWRCDPEVEVQAS